MEYHAFNSRATRKPLVETKGFRVAYNAALLSVNGSNQPGTW